MQAKSASTTGHMIAGSRVGSFGGALRLTLRAAVYCSRTASLRLAAHRALLYEPEAAGGAAESILGIGPGRSCGSCARKPHLPGAVPARPICRKERTETWLRSSASTSARPIPASPSWKARRRRSSRTPRARAPRRRSSPSPTTASGSSASRPSARRSPIRKSTIFAVKRLIGRRYDDPMVEKDKKLVPYKIVARRQRRRLGRGGRQDLFALADLRLHPAEDEGDRRSLSRPEGRAGRHHGPGLLQRRPAPGHQGRRQDRRPRSAAHHQRADRGGARLRPRQEEDRHHRGLRPRRRHVRHFDPRDRRRRVRGEVDQRRHVPRRRRLRHAARQLSRRRVPEGAGHRPAPRQARAAAAEGSRREGEDRALLHHADRDQPAVHHGRRLGSEAPDA